MITDRHANGRTALPVIPVPLPAVGATICDPTFGTSITRLTPPGYAIQLKEAFSINRSWFLAIGPAGGLVAFGLDPVTGKPRMSGGKQVQISIGGAMIPQGPNSSFCPIHNVLWSKKEDGVIYISACGTRVFKYNLNAYSDAAPMAGLMAGGSARSVASWPSCSGLNCRKGPVFLDFTDVFGAMATDGLTGSLMLVTSNNDETFSGFITIYRDYKNCQGVFAYRPSSNLLWSGVGVNSNPPPAFVLTGNWLGAPVNRRIIGTTLDASGRYLGLSVCDEPVINLSGCSVGNNFIYDLSTIGATQKINTIAPYAYDDLTHGFWAEGLTTGHASVTQNIVVEYFQGFTERRNLVLPNLIDPTSWWGAYVSATGNVTGPSGYALAGLLTTYSYDSNYGTPTPVSSCPANNCLYNDELLMFNLTGTHILRLAHTRSKIYNYSVDAYWDLPRPSFSADGQYAIFTSNWGKPSTATELNYSIYAVRMPAAWKTVLDDTVTLSTTAGTVTPNQAVTLSLSHSKSKTGALTLIQNGALPSGTIAGSCLFQVSQNGSIQLANDQGVMTSGLTGMLGLGSSPAIENSQCRIDVAASSMAPQGHANTEYKVVATFKKAFANMTLRAVMQAAGTAEWRDVATIKVDSGSVITWTPVPNMTPLFGNASIVTNNTSSYFAWGYSAAKFTPGMYFEFTLANFIPTFFSFNSGMPSSVYQSKLLSSIEVSTNWMGQGQLLVSQNYGTQVSETAPVTAGGVVRMTYTTGKVTYTLNGRVIGTTTVPADNAPLYLLGDMMVPGSTVLNPKVGP